MFIKLIRNALVTMCLVFPAVSYGWNLKDWGGAYKSKNWPRAIQIAAEGARAGNAEAQFFLGIMYQAGWGTTADNKKAAYWYEQSAKGGDQAGQLYLAKLYYNGQGVMKNYKSAYAWFSKSAAQGNPKAQYYMGQMYLRGEAVNKDLAEAYFWYLLASTAGFPDAATKLTLVEQDISTSQVNAAQNRAKNWRPSR